jgi:hypothetical protein
MATQDNKTGPGPSKEALRRSSDDYARKCIITTFTGSTIVDNSASYPTFDYSDLRLGKVLGKGGFGTVSEIRAFRVEDTSENRVQVKKSDEEVEEVEEGETESRNFIAEK